VGEAMGGLTEVLSGLREGERIALDPVKAGLFSGSSTNSTATANSSASPTEK
jgi:hypothetical protein